MVSITSLRHSCTEIGDDGAKVFEVDSDSKTSTRLSSWICWHPGEHWLQGDTVPEVSVSVESMPTDACRDLPSGRILSSSGTSKFPAKPSTHDMDRLGARPPTPSPQFHVLNHQSKRKEHPDRYTATWKKSRWTHLVQSRRRLSREWNGGMAA